LSIFIKNLKSIYRTSVSHYMQLIIRDVSLKKKITILKGGEETDWEGILGPRGLRIEFSFSFCLIYSRLGAEEVGNPEIPTTVDSKKAAT